MHFGRRRDRKLTYFWPRNSSHYTSAIIVGFFGGFAYSEIGTARGGGNRNKEKKSCKISVYILHDAGGNGMNYDIIIQTKKGAVGGPSRWLSGRTRRDAGDAEGDAKSTQQ